MYSLKWDQRQVSSELREASDLIGFSISKKQEWQETDSESLKGTNHKTSSKRTMKQTMPSVLLKVKREAQEEEERIDKTKNNLKGDRDHGRDIE